MSHHSPSPPDPSSPHSSSSTTPPIPIPARPAAAASSSSAAPSSSSPAAAATPATPPSAPRRNSRKHRQLVVPADTLLSFNHYTPTPSSSAEPAPRQKRTPQKVPARPRDHFAQSNFRFVISHAALQHPSPFASHPNLPIPWGAVDIVFLPALPQCPISLQPPRVPRLTPCGHVFDAVSIAQHIAHAHADNRPARCPLSGNRLLPEQLKPCLSPRQPSEQAALATDEPSPTQTPTLRLISRARGSTLAHVHSGAGHNADRPPTLDAREPFFSRYAFATKRFLLAEVDREAAELSSILAEEPELAQFVAVLRAELDVRRAAVLSRPPLPVAPVASGENSEANSARTPSDSSATTTPAPLSREDTHKGCCNCEETSSQAQQVRDQPSSAPQPPSRKKSSRWLFYQAVDGENVFLHPASHRVLSTEFGSELNGAPTELSDLPLLQRDRMTMDETLRKRYRFLDHLGDGCEFSFIELDLSQLVSVRALAAHEAELRERRDARRKKIAASERESRLLQRRETEVLQEYASSLRGVRARAGEDMTYSRDVHSFPALHERSPAASGQAVHQHENGSAAADVVAVPHNSDGNTAGGGSGSGGPAFSETEPVGAIAASSPGRWGAAVSSYSSVTSNMGLFPALGEVTGRDGSASATAPATPTGPAASSSTGGAGLRGVWRPAGSGISVEEGGQSNVGIPESNSAESGGSAAVASVENAEVPSSPVAAGNEEGGRKGRRWRGKGKTTTILLSNAGTPYHRQ